MINDEDIGYEKESEDKEELTHRLPKSKRSNLTYEELLKLNQVYFKRLQKVTSLISPEKRVKIGQDDLKVLDDLLNENYNYIQLLSKDLINKVEIKSLYDISLRILICLRKYTYQPALIAYEKVQRIKFYEIKYQNCLKSHSEKDIEKAEKIIDDIINLQKEPEIVKCISFVAVAHKLLCKAYCKFYNMQFEDASTFAFKALDLLEKNHSEKEEPKRTEKICEITQFLSEIYDLNEDYKSAYECYDKMYNLNRLKYGDKDPRTKKYKKLKDRYEFNLKKPNPESNTSMKNNNKENLKGNMTFNNSLSNQNNSRSRPLSGRPNSSIPKKNKIFLGVQEDNINNPNINSNSLTGTTHNYRSSSLLNENNQKMNYNFNNNPIDEEQMNNIQELSESSSQRNNLSKSQSDLCRNVNDFYESSQSKISLSTNKNLNEEYGRETDSHKSEHKKEGPRYIYASDQKKKSHALNRENVFNNNVNNKKLINGDYILSKGTTETYSFKIPLTKIFEPFAISIYKKNKKNFGDNYSSMLFMNTLYFDKKTLFKGMGIFQEQENYMIYSDDILNVILKQIYVSETEIYLTGNFLKNALIKY